MTPENISWLMIGVQLMMLIWMMAKAFHISAMAKELKKLLTDFGEWKQ